MIREDRSVIYVSQVKLILQWGFPRSIRRLASNWRLQVRKQSKASSSFISLSMHYLSQPLFVLPDCVPRMCSTLSSGVCSVPIIIPHTSQDVSTGSPTSTCLHSQIWSTTHQDTLSTPAGQHCHTSWKMSCRFEVKEQMAREQCLAVNTSMSKC